MFDLLAIGDTKLDIFLDLGNKARATCTKHKTSCEMRIKYGEKTPVDSARLLPAGSAPNVAIGVRRLGKKTSLETMMGDDITHTLTQDLLKQERVDTKHVHATKGARSSVSAILNFEGESTILAVHEPHTYHLHQNLKTDWVFVGEIGTGYKKLYANLKTKAKKSGLNIALNPGSIQLEDLDTHLYKLIAVTALLVVNKQEAQVLTQSGSHAPATLLRKLEQLGATTTIMTDGRKGAYAMHGETLWHAPMFKGGRIEATGAGDAFISGVLGAILHKKDIPTALAWGSVNAASAVQYVGAHEGLLKKPELEKRLRAAKRYRVITL